MSLRLFGYDDPKVGIFDEDNHILKDLSDEDWTLLLSYMERHKFAAGAILVEKNMIDRSLYFVASGSVAAISIGRNGVEREIAIIGEGSIFGEMAFLDGGPRSAAIKAREPVEVLVLSFESFNSLMAWNSRLVCRLLLDVGRVLSLRLRHRNKDL
jgi:CRP-like cAMP-binding protein